MKKVKSPTKSASREKKYIKSPLNYMGGKYKLLPQILPLLPEKIGTFYDLFCGGGNVMVNINAEKIVGNDILTDLVNFYRYIKKETEDNVFADMNFLTKKYNLSKENKDGYMELRYSYNYLKKTLPDYEHEREISDMLFALICHSFNNQLRYNKKGDFNTPFGKGRSSFNPSIQSNLKDFMKTIKAKNIQFTNIDFLDFNIERLSENDLVYVDPPYLISDATYNKMGGWGEDKERALLDFLDKVNEKGAKFDLSNVLVHNGQRNEILTTWALKYGIHFLQHNYNNCNYQKKDKVSETQEVLIVNYATDGEL